MDLSACRVPSIINLNSTANIVAMQALQREKILKRPVEDFSAAAQCCDFLSQKSDVKAVDEN